MYKMAAPDQHIPNLITGVPNTYEIHVNGKPINIDVNLKYLIEAEKYIKLEAIDSLSQISNLPGNYWILTTEPINHSFNPHFNHRPHPIEINGVKYTHKQLENILSGLTAKYCDSEGNPIVELQDAALLVMESIEEGRTWTPLTFEQAMEEE